MILIPKKTIDLSNQFDYDGKHFLSSTPCIIRDPQDPNQYLMLNRCNYFIEGASKTLAQYMVLDQDFSIVKQNIIPYSFKRHIRVRDGFEDIRIFSHKETLHYIGTYKTNMENQIVSGRFDLSQENVFSDKTIRVTFPTDYGWEKNWSLFDDHSRLHLVYRWYPLQIACIDHEKHELNLLETKVMPTYFKECRGSSCGVTYQDQLWFLVHFENNRVYTLALVVFNLDMKLIRYSEPFQLETNREFCYGMMIENGEFVFSYSTNNQTSKIAIYDYEYLTNAIHWNEEN